jgi:pimeloyl-ACP methyl ester carboxylesterase
LENINSRIVTVQGFLTHYYECGSGEPLIILHGGSEGASAWKNNIAVLAKNYHVYAPDLPGFGLSPVDLGSYRIAEVADFINSFSEAVSLPRFNLMGHSFGGGIAAHVALKYPHKVSKLVLVSSLCLGEEIAWWVRIFTVGNLHKILGRAVRGLYTGLKYLVNVFSDTDIKPPFTTASILIGGEISNFYSQNTVLLSRLPDISAPTLVMWGTGDLIVPPAHAYRAARLIPHCRVKVFSNCGHSVYRDRIIDFSAELLGFLG